MLEPVPNKLFKVVSWNVNSINSRLDRVLSFIDRHRPDVLMLQELKCMEDKFPREQFDAMGFSCAIYGQKTYNGVAIISPHTIEQRFVGFAGPEGHQPRSDDPAARIVAAKIAGIWAVDVYVPNGQSVSSDKYPYKLNWLRNLRYYLDDHFSPNDRVILAGDFNIAPDERDVHDPRAYEGEVHFSLPEREALQNVVGFGFVDTLRIHHTSGGIYSWWDYRAGAFPQNHGLRIDQIYATAPLASVCTAAYIDRDERKGEKPSDHAPVISEFAL